MSFNTEYRQRFFIEIHRIDTDLQKKYLQEIKHIYISIRMFCVAWYHLITDFLFDMKITGRHRSWGTIFVTRDGISFLLRFELVQSSSVTLSLYFESETDVIRFLNASVHKMFEGHEKSDSVETTLNNESLTILSSTETCLKKRLVKNKEDYSIYSWNFDLYGLICLFISGRCSTD